MFAQTYYSAFPSAASAYLSASAYPATCYPSAASAYPSAATYPATCYPSAASAYPATAYLACQSDYDNLYQERYHYDYDYEEPCEEPYFYEEPYPYGEYATTTYEPPLLRPLTLSDFPKATMNTLYIPYVDESVTEEGIRGLFTKYAIAMVKNVDFVFKTDYMRGTTQRSAYVHIKYWFFSRVAANFIQRLDAGKETRLVVNDPEYWLIFPSNAKKHTEKGRRLRLNLKGDDEDSDMPSLVNVDVFDEYSAYKYEMHHYYVQYPNLEYERIVPEYEYDDAYDIVHSTAASAFDTLDIGLKHEDDYVSDISELSDKTHTDKSCFSDKSVEEYRKERCVRRRIGECP